MKLLSEYLPALVIFGFAVMVVLLIVAIVGL